tara:strand:- start:321 stop:482 length:162 start_codon:yes stop_codon:yes gene_type:complete
MRDHEIEINTESLIEQAITELDVEGILFVDTEIKLRMAGIDPVAFAKEILNNG